MLYVSIILKTLKGRKTNDIWYQKEERQEKKKEEEKWRSSSQTDTNIMMSIWFLFCNFFFFKNQEKNWIVLNFFLDVLMIYKSLISYLEDEYTDQTRKENKNLQVSHWDQQRRSWLWSQTLPSQSLSPRMGVCWQLQFREEKKDEMKKWITPCNWSLHFHYNYIMNIILYHESWINMESIEESFKRQTRNPLKGNIISWMEFNF